jgi:hypothetical protein
MRAEGVGMRGFLRIAAVAVLCCAAILSTAALAESDQPAVNDKPVVKKVQFPQAKRRRPSPAASRQIDSKAFQIGKGTVASVASWVARRTTRGA